MADKKLIFLTISGLMFLLGITVLVLEIKINKQETQTVSIHSQISSQEDMEALELGRKVLAVRAAIENPDEPNALEAIRNLGLDSRYYTFVRGWLSMELAGANSILEANRENPSPEIKKRADFLSRAIRAIDLE